MKAIFFSLILMALSSCAVQNEAIELQQVDAWVVKVEPQYRYRAENPKYFVYLSSKSGSSNQEYVLEADESQLKYYPVGAWIELHPKK